MTSWNFPSIWFSKVNKADGQLSEAKAEAGFLLVELAKFIRQT